jgi:hypothetical protein
VPGWNKKQLTKRLGSKRATDFVYTSCRMRKALECISIVHNINLFELLALMHDDLHAPCMSPDCDKPSITNFYCSQHRKNNEHDDRQGARKFYRHAQVSMHTEHDGTCMWTTCVYEYEYELKHCVCLCVACRAWH